MSKQVPLTVLSCPKIGEPRILVRFLGNARGIVTHWLKRRPVACPGKHQCSHHGEFPHFKAYAPAQFWSDANRLWIPVVFEMTAGLCEITGLTGLRCQSWEVYRVRRSYGNRAVEGEQKQTYNSFDLPREFNVVRTVEALYGTKEIEWDVPITGWTRDAAPTSDDAPPGATTPAEAPAMSPQEQRDRMKQFTRKVFAPSTNGDEKK